MFNFSVSSTGPGEEGTIEGEVVIARMNARLQPLDRYDILEEPLGEPLKQRCQGQVTGGGTQLSEDDGIVFCDLEIVVPDTGDDTITGIIAELEKIGAPKGSRLLLDGETREVPFGRAEGIAVYLNGVDLPDEVYETCDMDEVIENFEKLMDGSGRYWSFWQGERETALFLYGASAARMREQIEPFMASYPLCQKARVERIA